MRLTLREQQILKTISDEYTATVRRGPKGNDYQATRQERLALYQQVGDLINRYEQYLAEQEQCQRTPQI